MGLDYHPLAQGVLIGFDAAKTIKIFDVTTKNAATKVSDLIGHEGPVWQVAWAHPKFGPILASCSYDRRVIIWREDRPNIWSKIYEYKDHELSVNSVAWAPHELGLILACGSSDGYISILTQKGIEWQKVRFLGHTLGVNAVSWAPAALPSVLGLSGEALPPRARFVSGGCDNTVKVWQFHQEWKEEATLGTQGGHTDWVRDVAWAPM